MESEYERTYERAWSALKVKVGGEPVLSPLMRLIFKLMNESWAEAVEYERHQRKLNQMGTDIPDEFLKGFEEDNDGKKM